MLNLICLTVRQRCGYEQNWRLRFWQRWWLSVKCILCILFQRKGLDYLDMVAVAYYDWHPTFNGEVSGQAGSVLMVGRAGWWYDEVEDSWP